MESAAKRPPEQTAGECAITVGIETSKAFAFWRNFLNFPKFMKGISGVETLSATRCQWFVHLSSGEKITWISEVTSESPGSSITWESTESESGILVSGQVRFLPAPSNLGTEVYLTQNYKIPAGKFTGLAEHLSGEDPKTLTISNLKRFKALVETGEIATIDGQPTGRE